MAQQVRWAQKTTLNHGYWVWTKLDLLNKIPFFDLFDVIEKMLLQERVLAFRPTIPMKPLSKMEIKMTPCLYFWKVRYLSSKASIKKWCWPS